MKTASYPGSKCAMAADVKSVDTVWFLKVKDKIKATEDMLCVLVMSCARFRVNPHSIVAWMSRNSLLEAGTKTEV